MTNSRRQGPAPVRTPAPRAGLRASTRGTLLPPPAGPAGSRSISFPGRRPLRRREVAAHSLWPCVSSSPRGRPFRSDLCAIRLPISVDPTRDLVHLDSRQRDDGSEDVELQRADAAPGSRAGRSPVMWLCQVGLAPPVLTQVGPPRRSVAP